MNLLAHLLIAKLLENVLQRRFIDRKAVDGVFVIAREFQQVLEKFRPADALSMNEVLKDALNEKRKRD